VACRLDALCIDARDPDALAGFWSALLGWEMQATTASPTLVPSDDTGFRIRFGSSSAPRRGLNQMHFDLTSGSLEDQEQTVEHALALGGHHLDVGQGPDASHVVLADPEGNEFCVIEPGNGFLAECGFLGALAGEGTRAAGCFWSEALGWPLVWDQDQETAIRSPLGGPKLTWGGPPIAPKTGKYRLHFDLAPSEVSQDLEVERLLALGASVADVGQGDVDWRVLCDPDGHEFCVLASDPGATNPSA
jgi:predicted enzyme related to lactoylglutathione lyase